MKQLAMVALLLTTFSFTALAQCATWENLSNKTEIEEAHVLYRDFFKMKNYTQALEYWKKAFTNAPAADGKRDWHYSNGIDMYLDFFQKETDAAKKEEYKNIILDLYKGWAQCVASGSIQINNTNMKEYVGYVKGRQAYNMFYILNSPYEDNLLVLKDAVAAAGNSAEYIIFDPYARIIYYQFTNNLMSKEEARDSYLKLNAIAEHNIANNKQLGTYYKQAKETMDAVIAPIERSIFDCNYFKDKLAPRYKADPKNGELIKEIYNTLLQQGCDKEDPLMAELSARYVAYADSINVILQDSLYRTYPAVHARDLYKQEKYREAIEKWQEAIEKTTDDEAKGEYSYWIATTKFRKLDSTSDVLSYARRGTSASSVAGNSYILIGDVYAKLARGCGDPAWEQRLAILAAIDKYATAKSVDPSVADEANRKIGIYNASKPERQAGFMRKISEGQSVNVPCIGENVRVSFVD